MSSLPVEVPAWRTSRECHKVHRGLAKPSKWSKDFELTTFHTFQERFHGVVNYLPRQRDELISTMDDSAWTDHPLKLGPWKLREFLGSNAHSEEYKRQCWIIVAGKRDESLNSVRPSVIQTAKTRMDPGMGQQFQGLLYSPEEVEKALEEYQHGGEEKEEDTDMDEEEDEDFSFETAQATVRQVHTAMTNYVEIIDKTKTPGAQGGWAPRTGVNVDFVQGMTALDIEVLAWKVVREARDVHFSRQEPTLWADDFKLESHDSFSDRWEKIVEYLQKSKSGVQNLVISCPVLRAVAAPDKMLKQKVRNNRGNAKKGDVFKERQEARAARGARHRLVHTSDLSGTRRMRDFMHFDFSGSRTSSPVTAIDRTYTQAKAGGGKGMGAKNGRRDDEEGFSFEESQHMVSELHNAIINYVDIMDTVKKEKEEGEEVGEEVEWAPRTGVNVKKVQAMNSLDIEVLAWKLLVSSSVFPSVIEANGETQLEAQNVHRGLSKPTW
ncbi:hypothetical protein QBC35DRAFT_478538 [Podospora australis]|uniref:Uncharacterized protein n=1 Tax=Podospora australis TaxID=1536484 RepID=A0AAN6WJ53_9PEZI|nr:hypothetical protein QBC35DRAFT_478538 [Podospora australis]